MKDIEKQAELSIQETELQSIKTKNISLKTIHKRNLTNMMNWKLSCFTDIDLQNDITDTLHEQEMRSALNCVANLILLTYTYPPTKPVLLHLFLQVPLDHL